MVTIEDLEKKIDGMIERNKGIDQEYECDKRYREKIGKLELYYGLSIIVFLIIGIAVGFFIGYSIAVDAHNHALLFARLGIPTGV